MRGCFPYRPGHHSRPHRTARAVIAAATVVAGLTLTGCASTAAPGASDGVSVVVAFYPLQFVAEQVGGAQVTVTNLVKPGTEPHDLELRPSQVAAISDADLVPYLAHFQPAVDDAVARQAKGRALDVASVTPLRKAPAGLDATETPDDGNDPHIWLDPTRLADIADAVANRLADIDPAHAEQYRLRATELRDKLTALDEEYRAGLAHCARHEIVTSHAAFGYLAARYGLEQVALTGVSPEQEAVPARLAEVAELARARGVTTIFFESLVSPKVAETLAREVGARAEVLDPIEGMQPGSTETYLTVMRVNLDKLRAALGCT